MMQVRTNACDAVRKRIMQIVCTKGGHETRDHAMRERGESDATGCDVEASSGDDATSDSKSDVKTVQRKQSLGDMSDAKLKRTLPQNAASVRSGNERLRRRGRSHQVASECQQQCEGFKVEVNSHKMLRACVQAMCQ